MSKAGETRSREENLARARQKRADRLASLAAARLAAARAKAARDAKADSSAAAVAAEQADDVASPSANELFEQLLARVPAPGNEPGSSAPSSPKSIIQSANLQFKEAGTSNALTSTQSKLTLTWSVMEHLKAGREAEVLCLLHHDLLDSFDWLTIFSMLRHAIDGSMYGVIAALYPLVGCEVLAMLTRDIAEERSVPPPLAMLLRWTLSHHQLNGAYLYRLLDSIPSDAVVFFPADVQAFITTIIGRFEVYRQVLATWEEPQFTVDGQPSRKSPDLCTLTKAVMETELQVKPRRGRPPKSPEQVAKPRLGRPPKSSMRQSVPASRVEKRPEPAAAPVASAPPKEAPAVTQPKKRVRRIHEPSMVDSEYEPSSDEDGVPSPKPAPATLGDADFAKYLMSSASSSSSSSSPPDSPRVQRPRRGATLSIDHVWQVVKPSTTNSMTSADICKAVRREFPSKFRSAFDGRTISGLLEKARVYSVTKGGKGRLWMVELLTGPSA
jgi:hypothetical protein